MKAARRIQVRPYFLRESAGRELTPPQVLLPLFRIPQNGRSPIPYPAFTRVRVLFTRSARSADVSSQAILQTGLRISTGKGRARRVLSPDGRQSLTFHKVRSGLVGRRSGH